MHEQEEWELTEYDDEQLEITGYKESHIAYFPNSNKGRENARLFLASRELRAACSELVEWVEAHAEERGLSWGPVHKARAAIAKASAA